MSNDFVPQQIVRSEIVKYHKIFIFELESQSIDIDYELFEIEFCLQTSLFSNLIKVNL